MEIVCVIAPKGNVDTEKTCGAFFYAERDYAKALKHFSEAIKLRDDGYNRYNLALALLQSGRQQEACQSFQEAARSGLNLDKQLRKLCKIK